MERLKTYWREAILENIPHGEEGSLQLTPKDAMDFAAILLKHGYAVCLTGGDIGDDVKASWLYAGTTENTEYADYKQVVFTSIDYLDDYPQAYNEDVPENDEEEDE